MFCIFFWKKNKTNELKRAREKLKLWEMKLQIKLLSSGVGSTNNIKVFSLLYWATHSEIFLFSIIMSFKFFFCHLVHKRMLIKITFWNQVNRNCSMIEFIFGEKLPNKFGPKIIHKLYFASFSLLLFEKVLKFWRKWLSIILLS